MKKFILVLFCVLCGGNIFARHGNKRSLFHAGLFPPLSSNGTYAWDYSNTVSVNLLAGMSAEETAFTLSGLAAVVRYNIQGLQLSGLFTYAGGNGRGAMVSGLANMVGNEYSGLQLSGLFNWTGSSGRGGQIGGLFNYSRISYNGIQAGGFFNYAENVNGAQISGLVNATRDFRGLQLGGIGNISRSTQAVQIAGLFNVAGNTTGFQLGGLFNISGNIAGFQLGGLFNKAHNVHGMQFAGLVNIAGKVRGVQFAGLVNISEDSDCPIGLVNIVKKGEMGVAVTYDALGSTVMTFRSGGKVTYGILGAGWNRKLKDGYVVEGGLGAHINCTRWFRINNEIKVSSFSNFRDDYNFVAGYSLLPAFRIVRRLELFGGASINYMDAGSRNASALLAYKPLWKENREKRTKQIFVGWQFGIQLIF